MVITEAGDAPNVVGLVYVAAFVPDAGESAAKLIEGGEPAPLQPAPVLQPDPLPQVFAHDLPAAQGAFLAAAQVPVAVADATDAAARAVVPLFSKVHL